MLEVPPIFATPRKYNTAKRRAEQEAVANGFPLPTPKPKKTMMRQATSEPPEEEEEDDYEEEASPEFEGAWGMDEPLEALDPFGVVGTGGGNEWSRSGSEAPNGFGYLEGAGGGTEFSPIFIPEGFGGENGASIGSENGLYREVNGNGRGRVKMPGIMPKARVIARIPLVGEVPGRSSLSHFLFNMRVALTVEH